MNVRKSILWRVPAYCIATGLIESRLIRFVLPYTRVTQPDGSISVSLFREAILYGVIFAVTMLIGWPLFRRMTRRELFWSAAVLVALHLVIFLLARIFQSSGLLTTTYLFMIDTWSWSGFISYLSLWLLNDSGGLLFDILAPFLFVLFGTKDPAEANA